MFDVKWKFLSGWEGRVWSKEGCGGGRGWKVKRKGDDDEGIGREEKEGGGICVREGADEEDSPGGEKRREKKEGGKNAKERERERE